MIKTGHLGQVELFALVTTVAVADVFLSLPQILVRQAGSAAWQIPLLSMILCLAFWFLVNRVFANSKANGLLSFSRRHIGNWAVWLVSIPILVYMLLDSANLLRLFSETVITTTLPRSPISFIILPFLLVAAFYAYSGVEGLSRVAWLLAPGTALTVVLLLGLNLSWLQPEYLFPIWGTGPQKILGGAFVYSGVYMNFVFIAILAASLRDQKQAVKLGYWSILAVGVIYTTISLVFVLIFPPDTAIRSPFPMYQLARLINLGRFMQRLESVFFIIWVGMILLKLSFELWLICYLLANVTRMPVYRPLVIPFALIVYAASFLPRNLTDALELSVQLLRVSGIVMVGLPFLILLWSRFRIRKEASANEQAPQTS